MWLASYLQDLLTHDVEELDEPTTRPRDTDRLRRYFEAYALNSAGVTEHKTIFDAAGITRVTATAYEDLLTRLLVVDQLPAWSSNRLKRLVRTPKRYVIDAALIAAALRLGAQAVINDGDLLGRMLETFVVAQLRPEAVVAESEPRLYHLRTEAGRHEVDVIAELGGGRVLGVEIKAAAAPGNADARHLRWLREQLGDRMLVGVILHTGPRIYTVRRDHRRAHRNPLGVTCAFVGTTAFAVSAARSTLTDSLGRSLPSAREGSIQSEHGEDASPEESRSGPAGVAVASSPRAAASVAHSAEHAAALGVARLLTACGGIPTSSGSPRAR